ncbi:MAG: methionine--tRNA ligase [Chloroflexi bacterium]|nr:methionine--tRNA ligase [Chloroflexota bacterium]MCI0650057.1 methionine--tRNA ligase [Chloroflexota bacterium]MCI0726529.1 methionine--tRNA ligase [Chloroflexota bacterium]
MNEPFYVTTPIYYVNDVPHLGHAYTTLLADVLARYARLQGRETFFLTGSDEHGQKVQEAAARRGVSPQTHADETVVRFKEAWQGLHIAYDDFIRTTEPRHVRVVETVLQRLWEQGDIYLGQYEGWYCVPDERFWTEKDLLNGACPDCGRPVERIAEPNYFFRMSAYQEWLVEYIQQHPTFIRPDSRRNQVLGFLRQPLGDLCISRPASRLSWGIPLPFDASYITYVWFDALLNYITAAGYLTDAPRFNRLWPRALHLVGKDILITHAVYWPTMLQAAGLPQPRAIFAHGWWIAGGAKMSKSLGNVVRPLALAEVYGVDAFRYFLMRDMVLGRDADFSEENLARRYQADLAHDLGNLLHRVTSMTERYFEGRVPRPGELEARDRELQERTLALIPQVFDQVDCLALNEALAAVMDLVGGVNGYLEQSAPWRQAKAGRLDRVATSLYTAAEALRLAAILLSPVMPERMAELWQRLGWQPPAALQDGLTWGLLPPGALVTIGDPLFPSQDNHTLSSFRFGQRV